MPGEVWRIERLLAELHLCPHRILRRKRFVVAFSLHLNQAASNPKLKSVPFRIRSDNNLRRAASSGHLRPRWGRSVFFAKTISV